jgi:hypothetical protein
MHRVLPLTPPFHLVLRRLLTQPPNPDKHRHQFNTKRILCAKVKQEFQHNLCFDPYRKPIQPILAKNHIAHKEISINE